MFIAAIFTIVKSWKQHKCSLINEWISKMWYIHTIEKYSSLERNEILTYATIWVNLENMACSEIRKSQKDKQ